MSKELDYFSEMKECNQLDYGEEEFKCKAIETALKRLEAIDNTNPNEAFKIVNECLKGIDTYEEKTGRKNPPCYMSRETLNTIKQALIQAERDKENLWNYNNIAIPFINEVGEILGIKDIDEMLDKIKAC